MCDSDYLAVMISLTVTGAARPFANLNHRVRTSGEKAMLLSDGEAVASVVPAGRTCTGAELTISWAGVPHLVNEEAAAAFAADLAESSKELRSVSSPWSANCRRDGLCTVFARSQLYFVIWNKCEAGRESGAGFASGEPAFRELRVPMCGLPGGKTRTTLLK